MEQIDKIFLRLRQIEANTPASIVLDEGTTLRRLFLRQSPILLTELFPMLTALLASKTFERQWLNSFQIFVYADKAAALDNADRVRRDGKDPKFYLDELAAIEKREKITSFDDYRNYIYQVKSADQFNTIENEYRYLNNGADGSNYIQEHYFLFKLAEFLYARFSAAFSSLERFDRKFRTPLEMHYQKIGISLTEVDQQFSKYGLLTLNENIRIVNTKEGQAIIDERIEKRFAVDVPRKLLSAIELAKKQNLIGQISFYVDNISELSLALEALEYGSIFDFDALDLPDITRLFSDESYEDSLWIKVNKAKSSITFEELFEHFPEFDDKVVTQLLHIELVKEKDLYYISHIDHEYILYSLLDYAERQRNGHVKGYDKLKTFKIDNAKIPLTWKFDGHYFLYLALNECLVNKNLVRDYFSRIQVTNTIPQQD